MIHQHLQQHEGLARYNQIVFNAIADSQPLDDVHTITLRGEYLKKIERLAINTITEANKRITQRALNTEIDRLLADSNVKVQEMVKISSKGIFVVVDAAVIDDIATCRTFQLIEKAVDQLDSQYGTIFFGDPVSFEKQDLPWLHKH